MPGPVGAATPGPAPGSSGATAQRAEGVESALPRDAAPVPHGVRRAVAVLCQGPTRLPPSQGWWRGSEGLSVGMVWDQERVLTGLSSPCPPLPCASEKLSPAGLYARLAADTPHPLPQGFQQILTAQSVYQSKWLPSRGGARHRGHLLLWDPRRGDFMESSVALIRLRACCLYPHLLGIPIFT